MTPNPETAAVLLAALLAAPAAYAADVAAGSGKVFEAPGYTVVRKALSAKDEMKRHNHPGRSVLLVMTKGRTAFTVNDHEKHTLKQGDVLRLDGSDYIAGRAETDSEFVVTLVGGAPDKNSGNDSGKEKEAAQTHNHPHSH